MKDILLKNCTVIDGTKEMNVYKNTNVLISNGKIVDIKENLSIAKAKVIDLNGAFVMPGMINLHVHIPSSGKPSKKKVADLGKLVKFLTTNPIAKRIGIKICQKNAKMALYSGVTTVRAVGGLTDFDSILRDKIKNKKYVGPRIISANNAIGSEHCHMEGTVSVAAKTTSEAVELVNKQIDTGADIIKLMITGGILDTKERGNPGVLKMTFEMAKACCDAAHKRGVMVAAHVEGSDGMKVAIDSGVDTIEHGSTVDKESLEAFKARNGAVVCTLSPAIPLAKLDPSVTGYSEDVQYNTIVFMNKMIENVNDCLALGVNVGLGTDTGCPMVTQYDMWRELCYFKKYINNVTNSDAIYLATLGNAKIAKIDELTGSVEKGKLADLIIVKDNPLDNLEALRNPLMVFAEGKLFKKKNKKFEAVEEKLDMVLNA